MNVRGRKVIDPKERIKSKSKVLSNGCWEWQGAKKGEGLKAYGSLGVGSRADGTRRTVSAHRYSYEVFIGEIPNGLFICHKCDNPSCVNPEHLFAGTRQDNVDDRERKGRNKPFNFPKHENHMRAKLTWKDVNEIRGTKRYRGITVELARKYKVGHKAISDVLNFKTWIPPQPKESE